MAHPLSKYARHVQRYGRPPCRYQARLQFVQDNMGMAKSIVDLASYPGKSQKTEDVLVELWDKQRHGDQDQQH
jgi:hypothetical protein